MPLTSSLRIPQKMPLEANNFGVSSSEVTRENVNGTDMYGTGLMNEVGEYNCFLNVIIQVGVPQPYFCGVVSIAVLFTYSFIYLF